MTHTAFLLKKFTKIYDQVFPLQKIKIKGKSLVSPWITKGIKNLQGINKAFMRSF